MHRCQVKLVLSYVAYYFAVWEPNNACYVTKIQIVPKKDNIFYPNFISAIVLKLSMNKHNVSTNGLGKKKKILLYT